jgi:hypothetical protein
MCALCCLLLRLQELGDSCLAASRAHSADEAGMRGLLSRQTAALSNLRCSPLAATAPARVAAAAAVQQQQQQLSPQQVTRALPGAVSACTVAAGSTGWGSRQRDGQECAAADRGQRRAAGNTCAAGSPLLSGLRAEGRAVSLPDVLMLDG